MCGHAWQHAIFHMQNAKICCENNNSDKTSHGICTRQDVEFP